MSLREKMPLSSLWKKSVTDHGTNGKATNPITISEESQAVAAKPTTIPTPKEPVTLAIVGCGQRGKAYSAYALSSPEQCKVIAIAEPRPKTRNAFSSLHNVDKTLVFETWQDLLKASADTVATVGKRLADAVVIAVQDHMHLEVVLAFAEQGWDILSEKPMATSIEDCIKMEVVVKKAGIIFGMGHVMRYSPYCQEITEVIRSKRLGRLVNVVQVEPVGHWHFAHSYVRGNWRNEKTSSFSLMTKSCHDIDVFCHWFAPATPVRVSSFGSLQHFRKSQKPSEAGDAIRCLECPMEKDCAYSAKKIYLDPVSRGGVGWPTDTIVDGVPDIENVTKALKETSYGKCVYESDNDVCDHQVVNMEFSDGSTVSFTMVAFTSAICMRETRLHFTDGEIIGDMNKIVIHDFRRNKTTTRHPHSTGGHGGGDLGLAATFVNAIRSRDQTAVGTDVTEVLNSHITVFAAEHSRREGRVVNCADFARDARATIGATQA